MSNADTFFNTVRTSNVFVYGRSGDAEMPYGGDRIHVANDMFGNPRIWCSNYQMTIHYASLTAPQINTFFSFLDRNSFGSKYRDVLKHGIWKAVYNVQENFMLPAYDSRRNLDGHKSETVVACRKCFIKLPTRIITIDHQGPKSGGEMMAFFRVFRGLGLTDGGPRHMGKNYQSVVTMAALVGGKSDVLPGTPRSVPLKTLNATGIIYYSILRHLGWLDWVKRRCMHHYLNLRPLCGPCNSSLSNRNIW